MSNKSDAINFQNEFEARNSERRLKSVKQRSPKSNNARAIWVGSIKSGKQWIFVRFIYKNKGIGAKKNKDENGEKRFNKKNLKMKTKW